MSSSYMSVRIDYSEVDDGDLIEELEARGYTVQEPGERLASLEREEVHYLLDLLYENDDDSSVSKELTYKLGKLR